MTVNKECLEALENTPNKETDAIVNETTIQTENYKSYYLSLGVPEEKIFLSAVISSVKLSEICNISRFLRIELAKQSNNSDDNTDFTFIISPFNENETEQSFLEKKGLESAAMNSFAKIATTAGVANLAATVNTVYMDATCCKNPPGNKPTGK